MPVPFYWEGCQLLLSLCNEISHIRTALPSRWHHLEPQSVIIVTGCRGHTPLFHTSVTQNHKWETAFTLNEWLERVVGNPLTCTITVRTFNESFSILASILSLALLRLNGFLRLIERGYVTLVLMSFGAFALIGIDYVIRGSIGRYMCLVSELISNRLNISPTLPATGSYATTCFPIFFSSVYLETKI